MLSRALQDLRFGLRTLAKNPGFTLIAILTLALGIGANTAIYTVTDALLLRPLAYHHAERLALISTRDDRTGLSRGAFSYPHSRFLIAHSKAFSGIAAFTAETFSFSDRGQAEELPSARVSWNFFDVLGVRPSIGRSFLEEEDQPGGRPVVLICHALWVRRFASDPGIAGKTIDLDSRPYTIVGVTPAGFQFAYIGANVDVWAPKVFELNIATPQQINRGAGYLNAVGRLAPGISLSRAQAEMHVLDLQYLKENPGMADADPNRGTAVDNLQEQLVANVRPAILILLGAVALLLLIACANVAGLLLSRSLGRRKEIAVRIALGAGRRTIIRQLLTESLLMSLGAAGLGILFSYAAMRALLPLAADKLPRAGDIHLSGTVLIFSLALSAAAVVFFGLAPAIQTSRVDPAFALREEGRGATSGIRRNRFRAALVVAQVALSMVLLVGAGLLIRSFTRLLHVGIGVDPANVLTMHITLPPAKYPAVPFLGSGPAVNDSRMVNFFLQLVRSAPALPGVRSATLASALPLNPSRFSPMQFEGQPALPLAQRPFAVIQTISPDYFETMRVPLLHGRFFTAHDDANSQRVAIVNETLARRYWPNDTAIGKHCYFANIPVEIVGVVADVRNVSLAAPASPEVYAPYPQLPTRNMNLVLRTAGDPHTLIAASRRLVASIDPDQPVTDLETLDEVLAASRVGARFTMLLLATFSGIALLLAIVGLYGVMSYSVAQRTQELGIRMALGAARGDIVSLVVRQGITLTATGLFIGMVAAFWLTRLMSSLVFETQVDDPATFIVSAVSFAAVAVLATLIPARRATRVDPAVALRT